MRILIGNLPADVTEEGVRDALSAFAPVEAIKLVHESGMPTALIELDTTRERATALAKRIHGRVYEGKALNAWVPAMDW
jgi:RNA recognition motif-containing protein